MPLKPNISKALTGWGGAIWGAALILLLLSRIAAAAPCDIRPNAPNIIEHDLSLSYCELCGYGYITVTVSNPLEDADMLGVALVEDLGSSGLTFDPTAPSPVTYSYVRNGLTTGPILSNGTFFPAIDSTNPSILTWTSEQIGALGIIQYRTGLSFFDSVSITYAVTRSPALSQEGLITANRNIQARFTYTTSSTEPNCSEGETTVLSTLDTLPLREPNPVVTKRGRNIDANQGGNSWTENVYGHVNDDIIWRIQIDNSEGTAPLQDLRFDDEMQAGSLDMNYACPTLFAAEAIALNNGAVPPDGTTCVPIGNLIADFDVDNPFGNPGSDAPDIVDVPEGGTAEIYLVGKISADSPNGSCSAHRTNTVSDLQWGCEVNAPAGGIFETSTGYVPTKSEATLYTQYREIRELGVTTRFSAVNPKDSAIGYTGDNWNNKPMGSRGLVTITITNRSGGTVKDIHLTDILPSKYVIDYTYTPRVRIEPNFANYPGMTDNIIWDNPQANPLDNKTLEFTLTSEGCSMEGRAPWPCSIDAHPDFPDEQKNMLRHGDRLFVEFRVVLIDPTHYDKTADLEKETAADGRRDETVQNGLDPNNEFTVENKLDVTFTTFCEATDPAGALPFNDDNISCRPEDLDIDIDDQGDPRLIFILTDTHSLRLGVKLTNNGGHIAEDYIAYIAFGATMTARPALPTGFECVEFREPSPALMPHDEWQKPVPIPNNATIFKCTGPTMEPGDTHLLNFEVTKSADTDADDLTFRADVVGEIHLYDGTLLRFPPPGDRLDGGTDIGNNYSLDAIRARVIGFNLRKTQVGNCSENNPPPSSPDDQVQIGEECTYFIEAGGWFGFQTPGWELIAIQDITVTDELPDGQGYISSTKPPGALCDTNILGVSLNPESIAATDETAPYWKFNQSVGERITTKDENWFRVNITSRFLNDPIDTRAVPNVHAAPRTNTAVSDFLGIFKRTGYPEEEIRLTDTAVGYPPEEDRQVTLTVTEPQITVVKEVCNEDLYGTGQSCSNFVPLADDGDAFNPYIYRITLTNEAESDGVTRAPAYDVTVTDILDPSDLALVIAFGSDGLDNDGDGLTDEAGEGFISDNTVKNGTPAQVTFSYSHSAALARINAGDSVVLYYRVDYDDDAAPLQLFTNTVGTTYDSLEGPSGNQTIIQCENSEACGARFYTVGTTNASVRIVPVVTRPKEITALSNTPVASSGTQPVVVGEEVQYRLTTSLPVAQFRNFVIRDELPAGIRCAEAPAVNLNAPPYSAAGFQPGGTFTPTCTDSLVEWNFGDQRVTNGAAGDRYNFQLNFIARVENTATTNNTDVISNGDPATTATASYIDEDGNAIELNYGQVDIRVTEPAIALTKSFAVANADAADILTVTVTAANTGTATAYNLRVYDNLVGRNMTYIGNPGGSNPPNNVDTTTFGPNQPIFSWNAPNGVNVGDTISFTFEIQVDDGVQPHELLDNTLQADWTSLPSQSTALNSTGLIGANGSETGMRNGAIPNAGDTVNDYETTASAQTSVPVVALDKTDLNPAAVPAIGERKEFAIEIRLPEGVTNSVRATDTLNAAGISYVLENNATYDITYTFQGIASINGAAPAESAFNAFPADGAVDTIIWDIGTVATQTENDTSVNGINPLIRIHYYARVNNDLVTDNGDDLQNSVVATYANGETGAQETLTDNTSAVTVVEPVLVPYKTVQNRSSANLDDPPAGGDLLEYAIAISNTGTSTAYDVNVVDTIPAELSLYGSFTPTATIGGVPVLGFVAMPANAPNGPLIWGRGNGDNSLDIPAGQSLIITYQARLDAAGSEFANSAMVDWTSLNGSSDDERDGEGCPAITEPNDYCAGPASATATSVDINDFTKNIDADTFDTSPWSTTGDAIARVGDFITYRLSLLLSGGLTQNIVVQDTLPGGMAFVETVSINGDTSADYTPPDGSHFYYAAITSANVPTAGDTGTLTWTIGNVVNGPTSEPPPNALEIIYRARILPDAGIAHQDSTTLTNSANMSYATTAGPAVPVSDTATVTVVQPILSVTKSAVTAGGDTVLASDEIVTYTVDIANTGDAPAYDPQLTDILPVGMRKGAAGITTVSMELLSGTALSVLTPAYNAATGVVTWEYDTGVANQYTIPAGDTLRIVYRVQTDTTLSAGMTLTNQVQVQHYYSLDDDDIPSHGGIDGQAQAYGPTNMASVTLTTDIAGDPLKENPAQTSVAVGEPFTYRITVPQTPLATALLDVRITDDLSLSAADMRFVSVTKVSGSGPWTPVNTGTDTFIVIADPTIGIDIPAGEQVVLDITVLLEDTDNNFDGRSFINTVTYTYNQVDGDPNTQTAGGSDSTTPMTIVDAGSVTLEKSGPTTMDLETPGRYTLNFRNTGTGTAWNPTITDQIPNDEAAGGMCAAGPSNVTAQIFEADNTSAVSAPLVENVDFTVEFEGLASESDTFCVWRFNLLSAAGGVPADNRLIITYDLNLDPDTENGTELKNVAGATRWYSTDPNVTNADPRVQERVISDGTPGTLDYEDAHTVTAQTPVLQFDKSVINITTGQDPGSTANPGNVLQYTITITNTGPVGISSFDIEDELDALNRTPVFQPGTLTIVTTPAGADTSGTTATGGVHGTGLLNIANLSIGTNDSITIVYQVTLVPVIDNGTVVKNQAQLITGNPNPILSDDPENPALTGNADPTQTVIESAPEFRVLKTSTIMEGDPAVLMAGERLRYTITIENIGSENAVNVILRDYIPANTSYVANSTTLNGIPVSDPAGGVSPLQSGMPINAPGDTTSGNMAADDTPGGSNMATVTFDVIVNPDVMDGLVIENQGFVGSDGAGSGDQPEQPSDDPNTPIPDDPTQNVVGNLPYLYALKTVEIYQDSGSPGLVDPGDVLRYTFTISNLGAIVATNAVLIDEVPNNTTYVDDSIRVNGVALAPHGSVLPLIAGVTLQSSDNPGEGIITPEERVVVTFEVTVDDETPVGTIISNQGSVTTTELSPEPTDSDGLPSNGDQPTVIVVGDTQVLTITKEVYVVNEGPALAGGQLEYVIRVTNVGYVPALNVEVIDDFTPERLEQGATPLAALATYVDSSGTLNGAPLGISFENNVLTADYAGQYGFLPAGETVVVRFRVKINSDVAIGTPITNIGEVQWSDDKSETASVSIDVGGTPDSAALNGTIWHDFNFNRIEDPAGENTSLETLMEGWTVELYHNGQLVTSVLTDASGNYSFSGLLPNMGTTNTYEIQFHALGYGANTASLGDTDSPFTDGPQRITEIVAAEGSNLQDLNLPLWPNGVVYNSVARVPVEGSILRLLNAATGEALPGGCFNDPLQQNQLTTRNGLYKFDLNFSDAACPAGGAYLIEVVQPATGYLDMPSSIIPPASNAATEPFSVPDCPGSSVDAMPSTTDYCEATIQPVVPPLSATPRSAGTTYYLHLTFNSDVIPGHSQIFYNPIPIDPVLDGAVAITKVSALKNVTRASLVPYTITVTNVYGAPLYDMSIVDLMPPGFKYVEDSARLDGEPVEPQANGRQLIWDGLQLDVNQRYTLKLLLVVGAGVSEGEFVNTAVVRNSATGDDASGKATATVRVIPDPTFDCTDVIGKVFDDYNLNGSQDSEEKGLPGVRVVTARGLISTTDEHGRFHITCATVPDEDRGSNFILKVDERSLPSGYRLTTENPRVQRATRGHMLRFNFGATIFRVVRMDIADGAFEPDSKELRLQWQPRINQLLSELLKAPSTLRLSYLADVEKKKLVKKRLKSIQKQITEQWETLDGGYPLMIETEVFWRRGAPFGGR